MKISTLLTALIQSLSGLRRFGQTVLGIIFRHPITGTSIIPILPDGRIVLIRRKDNGLWSLPGGMVDWGEDILQTVHRELKEETGLEITHIGRLVGIYSSPDRDPRVHSICIVVAAEVQGEMLIQDILEVMEIAAFPPSALPKPNMSHDSSRHLQDYFNGLTVLA